MTKEGSTEFYRGYSDGYNTGVYTGSGKDYAEGFDKGINDVNAMVDTPRYKYVEPNQPSTTSGTWPFATKAKPV